MIANNTIEYDTTFNCGGGIYDSGGGPVIRNNVIAHNRAIRGGGGLSFGHSSRTSSITNNVIYDNWGGQGGGLYCYDNSGTTGKNCIFWANTADSLDEISVPDNLTHLIYCDIQDGFSGQGNTDVAPIFRNAALDDFHLMSIACGDSADSPCIDAGEPSILDSLISCSWGQGSARSDMGAYGGGDSIVVEIDAPTAEIPDRFRLYLNHPNPFNPTTTISYDLPAPAHVKIDIFDLLGRHAATLFDGEQKAGHYNAVWNAERSSSGIYFYRIQAGKFTETKKMVLMK